MADLSGKVVLVTGASRGLGRALVEKFVSLGAAVSFCSRRLRDIEPVERELTERGGRALAVQCNVAVESDVARLVHRTEHSFGRIDVVINNASLLGPRVPYAEYPTEPWRQVIGANLTGTFFVCRDTIPVMQRHGGGAIVNVSSSVGHEPREKWGAYLVSKWGVEGLSLSLAEELRSANVRVNLVDPGPMRTAMRATAYPNEDPARLRTPDEISEVFAYLASDASAGVTGQQFRAWEFTAPSPPTST